MSLGSKQPHDPDDFFSETRMSFGDHLEDLQTHLWRAIWGFCAALVFGFLIGEPLTRFISAPVEVELTKYWRNFYANKVSKVLAAVNDGTLDGGQPMVLEMRFDVQTQKEMGVRREGRAGSLDIIPHLQPILAKLQIEDWVDSRKVAGGNWVKVEIKDPLRVAALWKKYETDVGRDPGLTTLNAQEAFLGYIKVSVIAGFVIASPWIFYQLWSFIAAGLYPHEKRYVNVFLPVSIGLFLSGVLLCQFFVIPKAISALLWFNDWLHYEPAFRFNDWLTFAVLMPVVFGLSFQTPLVMLFMERIGIATVESLRAKRRLAWFIIFVFGAVILPTGDFATLFFLCIPMCLLYELGIWMCILWPRSPAFDFDDAQSDELIEV